MAFQNEIAIARSDTFEKQTTFGTALVQAKLDLQERCEEIQPFQLLPRIKQTPTCQGEFVESERTTSALATQSFRMTVTPQRAAGWLYFFFGTDTVTGTDPKVHDLRMMTTRNVPVTTLRIGHVSGDVPESGWICKDVAVTSIRLSATAGQDSEVRMDVSLVMNADRAAASGTTWPACATGTPALLSDGDFAIDSGSGAVSYASVLRSIDCAFANNVLVNDDPFTGSSIYPTRFRRSAVRGYGMNFLLEAVDSPADALAALARANTFVGTESEVVWSIGDPGGNDFLDIVIPKANLRTQEGAIQGYYGEAQSSVLNLTASALRDASIATSPLQAVATIPVAQQAGAFGVAA